VQTQYNDGRPDKLEQIDEKDAAKKVKEALADPAVKSVAIHKPGSVFSTGTGKMMRVDEKGKLCELTRNQRKRYRQKQRRGR
jgi:hypothetical protein